MDCVNHSGVNATAYCQTCGKALCANCVSNAPGGQILCSNCVAAWQSYQTPFAPAQPSGPNPSAAAVLGLIPGVGAMYNGQFFKGLIHVVIFAVLISITDHYGIFGIFIAAWVLYQSFEAYHTAIARRDGQPLPDPLGLNEVGNWLNLGTRPQGNFGQPGPGQPGAGQQPGSTGQGSRIRPALRKATRHRILIRTSSPTSSPRTDRAPMRRPCLVTPTLLSLLFPLFRPCIGGAVSPSAPSC